LSTTSTSQNFINPETVGDLNSISGDALVTLLARSDDLVDNAYGTSHTMHGID
jgi:hypothetical protein